MKIAFLTSGGNAPCLNSSIGRLLSNFSNSDFSTSAIGYLNGFMGLLRGESIALPLNLSTNKMESFYFYGGSFIGNSRVKLTNIDDCINKKLVSPNETPLEVAANQLIEDKIDILFTIGGDDTNTTAKDLRNYINEKNIEITVVGIPKTIDNDIYPIKRSLGAYTAAYQGAKFFENIVNENFMGKRHLIVHEVMGRNSGWLTAYTAKQYHEISKHKKLFIDSCFDSKKFDIHGIYVPERNINIITEVERLSRLVEDIGCINLFVSEGAFLDQISKENNEKGQSFEKDAFGHIKLDSVNAAKWFSSTISKYIDFDRILIQKSGYFARSASPNKEELEYIFKICDFAYESALKGKSGVSGIDERKNKLQCINFNDIKGDKGLDIESDWFLKLINLVES
tara:strand:+ start:210 stop:1397 length:1188 start_codon:yes stop_codon:yes gene_type:complete